MLRYEDDDFVADTETLGGLEFVDTVGTIKRSTIWRYRFDVGQDFKLSVGDKVFDPPGGPPEPPHPGGTQRVDRDGGGARQP